METIRRIYVEKKKGFDVEACNLQQDLRENLGIKKLSGVRVLARYDVAGIDEEEYQKARCTVFSEPPVDWVYDENCPVQEDERMFGIEYLPGQYDQRADSAAQCIQITTLKQKPLVLTARMIILKGDLDEKEIEQIKKYLINPVDSREAKLEKPETLKREFKVPNDVATIDGFINLSKEELIQLRSKLDLAMSDEDFRFCQEHFKNNEKRDPSLTEVKMLDTYWSDHCRHTTFTSVIDKIDFEETSLNKPVQQAFKKFLQGCDAVNPDLKNEITLMRIATLSMKEMRELGKLEDMEVSGEINACSIIRPVKVDNQTEEWLVMFKNETHNHPTEIEPFGGAATCLGGAIRDPLSGRAYVHQAMRVTGSGDPRQKIEDTLAGKLPQRKITTEAAQGYSSYGNQIGLATGLVSEIYDSGYLAKRMEVGAVVGAVPRKDVIREEPVPGDQIILVGGKTGRDGIGGATGSSKEHTEESIYVAGAEVQKGNPPEERKLQRLFRNPEVTHLIKKSNDFGAGGVSVAIGELADGLRIDLDKVPKKYEGLDGTELALSESQERMSVVVAPKDVEAFFQLSKAENLEANVIAEVTEDKRLKMFWRGKKIIDVGRDFINTHGVKQHTSVRVVSPRGEESFFNPPSISKDLKTTWLEKLQDINNAGQMGLIECFDSTIGAGTVFMPYGGKYQQTPMDAMVSKIPVLEGKTTTGTVMSYGFNPKLSTWSPFHGAVYAVIEAVAKVVAVGGDYSSVRLSLQEYFEKLGKDPEKWGKPFSALLGAYYAMVELGVAAIGGKDSMSGSFMDLNVPPTLIAFAVNTLDITQTQSPEFKQAGNMVALIPLSRDQQEMPDFNRMKSTFSKVGDLIRSGKIYAAQVVRQGGIAIAVSKMSFGNRIGVQFESSLTIEELFAMEYGAFVVEVEDVAVLSDIPHRLLGRTVESGTFTYKDEEITIQEALESWHHPLESVFPTQIPQTQSMERIPEYKQGGKSSAAIKIPKPRVIIPVFPGSNCEYDTERAFRRVGAIASSFVFCNLKPEDVEESLNILESKINESQIIMIPGGFSSGDEPDGSGKFIAAVFRNPRIRDAVMNLLNQRDGLMLGICNGFQALVKLGLLPHGVIREIDEDSPTLTFNTVGHHMSCMVSTKVVSNLSPWFHLLSPGEIHEIAISHGEGRFVANEQVMKELINQGQVATQYVDLEGNPTYEIPFNPNGSINAIEGITSPDGRILGKMGHSERYSSNIFRNIPGEKDQKLFESGVKYFQ